MISTGASATITVKGDVINNSGSSIINNGIISLSGNWTNNSGNNCFGASTGTVILNGSAQNIGGSYATAFYNLTLLLPGSVTLQSPISTSSSGVLALGAKKLNLNGNTLTVNNPSAAAITNATGYILSENILNQSKVAWVIGNTAGNHVIPFGTNAGALIPFTFNLLSGNAGTLTVSTYATTANNLPLPVAPVPVTHVRNESGNDNSGQTVDRFWQVDAAAGFNASLTFTYAPLENAAAGNTAMRAQRWNTSTAGWDPPALSQSNPTMQSVMVNNVALSGPWAIASSSSPLPVELLYFNAEFTGDETVACKWTTLSEKDNDFFTVMRSRNGVQFEDAGLVDGHGTSVMPQNYSFEDQHPYKGISYYRLKQTDFNGSCSFSKTVSVSSTGGAALHIYPNPSNGVFQLLNSNPDEAVNYEIRDVSWRIVVQGLLEPAKTATINLNNEKCGMYLVRATSGSDVFSGKLEKVR